MRVKREYIYCLRNGARITRDRLVTNASLINDCEAIFVQFSRGDYLLTYEIVTRKFAQHVGEVARLEKRFKKHFS